MITYVIDDALQHQIDNDMEGNEFSLMLEYMTNSLRGVQEDVFDLRFHSKRIYAEREGNVWRIYRIENITDEDTTKVQELRA